jgi:UDP-2-acetamido-2-deoxy-ribo-hexuluronate aminotransferase
MDTLQCAVVLAKLERFDWEIERRVSIGQRYQTLLREAPGIGLVTVRPDCSSVWAQFTVMVEERERVVEGLKAAGIPTAVHYPKPIHLQPAYIQYGGTGGLSASEELARRVLSLPMSPYLDEDDQDRVVRELLVAVEQNLVS